MAFVTQNALAWECQKMASTQTMETLFAVILYIQYPASILLGHGRLKIPVLYMTVSYAYERHKAENLWG